jgi:hypothetical protein
VFGSLRKIFKDLMLLYFMRFGKAVLLGILFWIFIFVEISVTKIGLGLSQLAVLIINYILIVPFSIIIASMYYKSRDRLNGFVLGLIVVVTGIILDAVITVPMFVNGDYEGYFLSAAMLVGFFEAIVVFGVYDVLRRRK